MSHHDCQCYYLPVGDSWTKIDYSQKPETWMKPHVKGVDTGLVEIPANWYLDVSATYNFHHRRCADLIGLTTPHVHQSLAKQPWFRECT